MRHQKQPSKNEKQRKLNEYVKKDNATIPSDNGNFTFEMYRSSLFYFTDFNCLTNFCYVQAAKKYISSVFWLDSVIKSDQLTFLNYCPSSSHKRTDQTFLVAYTKLARVATRTYQDKKACLKDNRV